MALLPAVGSTMANCSRNKSKQKHFLELSAITSDTGIIDDCREYGRDKYISSIINDTMSIVPVYHNMKK